MTDSKRITDINLIGKLQYSTKHFVAEIVQLENETFEVTISKKVDDFDGACETFLTHFMTFKAFSFSYAFDNAKSKTNSLEKILQSEEN